jgi:predicted RNA-binding Zn ribbon-like protein
MCVMADPRPLTGEPLAVDLLNTAWVDGGVRHDLLDRPGGVEAWGHAGADPEALRVARDAIRAALGGDTEPVNAVLAHGRVALRLGADGAAQRAVEVDDERWRLPWLAAQNLLELDRDRIRACAGHDCVLHFYDTSRAGKRMWCSMAGCGNRAKARRHYERSRLPG